MHNLRKKSGGAMGAALAMLLFTAALYSQPRAQAQPGTQSAAQSGAKSGNAGLTGQVTDPSGLAIPAVTVEVTGPGGAKLVAQTDDQGRYTFRNLAPGTYAVRISLKGFANFEKTDVVVTPGKPQVVNAQLAVALEKQEITVQGEANQLSVSESSNASALVIKGKDLQALSDDPDELASDLQALAGPSAGPNGGQIYIDGFTGGQLPNKSDILEIRVNQNPFSAEYDKVGYGRIEITTKPGASQYHGQAVVNGNASAFNSRNPFATAEPPYHSEFYNGNFGGPINKKMSFFLDFFRRDIEDDAVVNTFIPNSTFTGEVPYDVAVLTPQTRTNFSPRIDYQLSEKNVLSVRYQWWHNTFNNAGLGQGFSLPSGVPGIPGSQAYSMTSTENTVQVSDTQVISEKVFNQTRFQYLYESSGQVPQSVLPTLNVVGAFTGGGSFSGTSRDYEGHYELQNLTSILAGKHSLVFGTRLRDLQESDTANSGFNGEYSFKSLTAYDATELALQQCPAPCSQGVSGAREFILTAGEPLSRVQLFDGAIFGEDQWRVRPNISLSLGLRFEWQNRISDHSDFAPRIGLAWGIGKGATPKTVLRAGTGIFYDRFGAGQVLEAERLNGTTQQEYIVESPDFFPNIPSIGELATLAASQGGAVSQNTVYRIDPNLHAPYMIQSAVGLERQLAKNSTVSVTYLNSHGLHQLLTDNINAPYGVYPTDYDYPFGNVGNIYQYESVGLFNQNQLIANFNVRAGAKLSLFGFYTLNYANSDTNGAGSFPMNPYDILEDYGSAAFNVRHRVFTGGSIYLPHGVNIFPFMMVSSGMPFNITTGGEFNGGSIINSQRPAFASGYGPGAPVTAAAFNASPSPGEPLIPINYGVGPDQFSLNLRVSKTFGFGEKKGRSGGGGGFGGGGYDRGGPRGLQGRGLSGGGAGGFFGGGPASNSRYTLEFSVNARNVFNIVNLAAPVGDLSSPLFGQSNQIAGGFGGGQAFNRRIDLQVRFSF